MKRAALCLALVGLFAAAGQAGAVICTVDDVPAATLLLPYFEVDIVCIRAGVTTLFSVNNASANGDPRPRHGVDGPLRTLSSTSTST